MPLATPVSRARTVMTLATALLATAAASLVSQPASAGPAQPDPPRPRLDWRPCADTPAADCATLRVPVDWAHPDGATIALALARIKATDPAERQGTLVINPGGPGGSGVQFVKLGASGLPNRGTGMLSANLRAHFDIVSWDPRGVGQSNPIRCDAGLINDPVSPVPTNAAEFATLQAYNRDLFTSCLADTGPVFDHVDTASTVRDLEAIRVALGEGQLTFWAMSYGTLIGQQYAELFPTHLRALALDSNLDHSLDTRTHATMLAHDLEQSYTQFARWCLRTPSCPLASNEPWTILDELYARADAGTIHIPGYPDQTVTPLRLSNYLRGSLMDIKGWVPMAQEFVDVLAEPVSPPAAAPTATTPTTSDEVTQTVITCEDNDWGTSTFAQLQQLQKAMNQVAPHTRFSSTAYKEVTQCLGWPRPVSNPQHRLHVQGAPPILLVDSRYDVAAPYPGALDVARQIGPGATMLTYDGIEHVAYGVSACVASITDAYLISLALPHPATHCPTVYPSP